MVSSRQSAGGSSLWWNRVWEIDQPEVERRQLAWEPHTMFSVARECSRVDSKASQFWTCLQLRGFELVTWSCSRPLYCCGGSSWAAQLPGPSCEGCRSVYTQLFSPSWAGHEQGMSRAKAACLLLGQHSWCQVAAPASMPTLLGGGVFLTPTTCACQSSAAYLSHLTMFKR